MSTITITTIFVGQPDPLTPVGCKGLGETCLISVAAAVANAIYHATGVRLRSRSAVDRPWRR